MTPSCISARILPFLKVIIQIVLFMLIWIAADWVSKRFIPVIPGGVLGLLFVLALLWLRVIRKQWLVAGGAWLLGEMLLFFVPAVIGIIQYPELVREHGLAILIVIVGSTFCVMLSTALVVDLCWQLESRWRKNEEGAQ